MPSMGRQSRAAKVWALISDHAEGGVVSAAHLCAACVAAVEVDGAAVWLTSATDRRALVHATDEVSRRLDDWQFTLGEGPSVEAWTSGGPVLVADLSSWASTVRWPVYAPAAALVGVAALFVFPLQIGAIRVGTLDLYRLAPGPLSGEQLSDALAFSFAALAVVLSASRPAPEGSDELDEADGPGTMWPFDGLGEGRVEVYQATGMVAVQLDVALDEAFVRLRAHAFTCGVPLNEIAHQVVDRTLRFSPGADSN